MLKKEPAREGELFFVIARQSDGAFSHPAAFAM
jgi:hypothetical protein